MRALITGASSGIGLELARCFAADHHDLVLTGRSAERLDALASDLRRQFGVAVDTIPHDLAQGEAAQRLYDAVRERNISLGYLVNNAGFGLYGDFVQQSPGEQFEMLQLNMVSLVELTRLVLPDLLALKNGRVLNVASVAAFQAGPKFALYSATKAFVLSFSEALGYEVKGTGVTVTCLCPGPTTSAFGERSGFAMAGEANKHIATAAEVAQYGYAQMFAGTPVAVHGAANRLMVMSTRLAPRSVVTSVAAKILAGSKAPDESSASN